MKALSILLSIFAIVLIGVLIGYLLWGPIWELPQEFTYDKYDVLKDTLIIVLTFVVIAIAVLGAAVYVIVSQRLEAEAGKRIRDESRRWITRLATSTGYSFWKIGFRDEAIRLTEEAHVKWAYALSEKEPGNQELIGSIRNNLAYYYSQTNQKRQLARGYAAYIHKISHKFPDHREIWEETCREVLAAFPD